MSRESKRFFEVGKAYKHREIAGNIVVALFHHSAPCPEWAERLIILDRNGEVRTVLLMIPNNWKEV